MGSIGSICDPQSCSLEDAIRQAKVAAQRSPRYLLDLARVLQTQCITNHADLPAVFRGLDVLAGILEETRLIALLRPFLRSSNRQIVSKCALIIRGQPHSLSWLTSIMSEGDERMRAHLI